MRSADFDFALPPELIAQQPASVREGSRLLVLHRTDRRWEHRRFPDLTEYLRAGDLLVFNDSRVIPARLRGQKFGSGGAFEILLLEPTDPLSWWCLARPGKSLRPGTRLNFVHTAPGRAGEPSSLTAEIVAINAEGHRQLRFAGTTDVIAAAHELGELPLPPYITRSSDVDSAADRERYQTVYARADGSVAAPTAGLHFGGTTLNRLKSLGVELAFVTLHVGLGTFAPVKVDSVREHPMHEERYQISDAAAAQINAAKAQGRRVIAIGTTSARVLESAARQTARQGPNRIDPTNDGRTRLFLYPPAAFQIVDALFTNFHLPQSTLLMLASAFASPGATDGRTFILDAYTEAVRERYRFFSYGDAMLIL